MHVGIQIQLEEIDQKIILRITGRIDAASSTILERKINSLLEEHRKCLLLDFMGVDYLSSAGMRVLLASFKKMRAQKGIFGVFSVAEDVGEIIRLAGFDKILLIFPNEKEALQYRI